jgi:putative oxidoreductase
LPPYIAIHQATGRSLKLSGKWEDITLNLLRVVAGFLFFQHGAQKLFGVLGGEAVTDFVSLRGLAGILEFFGGLMILFGAFTRYVAFVLSGLMAVAYWMSHGPNGFWPIQNRGELAALYCFLFLFFWAYGGGRFSVDGLRKKS